MKWPTEKNDANLRTATATLPRIHSGIGSLRRFISFSRHVPISSMHIHTSSCLTRQQRRVIYQQ